MSLRLAQMLQMPCKNVQPNCNTKGIGASRSCRHSCQINLLINHPTTPSPLTDVIGHMKEVGTSPNVSNAVYSRIGLRLRGLSWLSQGTGHPSESSAARDNLSVPVLHLDELKGAQFRCTVANLGLRRLVLDTLSLYLNEFGSSILKLGCTARFASSDLCFCFPGNHLFPITRYVESGVRVLAEHIRPRFTSSRCI